MFKVLSFQLADSIDLKQVRNLITAERIFADTDELFYKTGADQYAYVFKYGVVCFLNYDESRVNEFIKIVKPACRSALEGRIREEYLIEKGEANKVGNNMTVVARADTESFRIIMINVSQSVALDYYSEHSTRLLEETNVFTDSLEKTGNLNISGNKLKRFIGKTLNLMNRITENLYIFDSAPSTWEDESLDKMDMELKKIFDLQSRYREIHEELQIIKENLDLFKDIMHNRRSNALEIVIIILILVEVFDLIIGKIFNH